MPRPHYRTRPLAWVLLTFASLSALIYLAALRYSVGVWLTSETALHLANGGAYFEHDSIYTSGELRGMLDVADYGRFFICRRPHPPYYGLINAPFTLPLWLPTLLFLTSGLYLLHRTRNTPGHCTFCRYDLTGLSPNSPCPECGRTKVPLA